MRVLWCYGAIVFSSLMAATWRLSVLHFRLRYALANQIIVLLWFVKLFLSCKYDIIPTCTLSSLGEEPGWTDGHAAAQVKEGFWVPAALTVVRRPRTR